MEPVSLQCDVVESTVERRSFISSPSALEACAHIRHGFFFHMYYRRICTSLYFRCSVAWSNSSTALRRTAGHRLKTYSGSSFAITYTLAAEFDSFRFVKADETQHFYVKMKLCRQTLPILFEETCRKAASESDCGGRNTLTFLLLSFSQKSTRIPMNTKREKRQKNTAFCAGFPTK